MILNAHACRAIAIELKKIKSLSLDLFESILFKFEKFEIENQLRNLQRQVKKNAKGIFAKIISKMHEMMSKDVSKMSYRR